MSKKKEHYNQIVSRLLNAMDVLGIDNSYLEEGNPIIYHYTKLEHAKKILRGKKLMFTKGSKLVENDKDELPLGCMKMTLDKTKLIQHVLKNTNYPLPVLAEKIRLINNNPDFHEESVMESLIHHRSKIGIACFNETPENDYLWKNYGAEGGGVCIGFRSTAFNHAGVILSKVKYDDVNYTVDYGDHGIEALMVWTLVKKAGFTQENEIRGVCFDPARRCDHLGRIKFDKKDVAEIHIGSKMGERERIQLQNLLKDEGYADSVKLTIRK